MVHLLNLADQFLEPLPGEPLIEFEEVEVFRIGIGVLCFKLYRGHLFFGTNFQVVHRFVVHQTVSIDLPSKAGPFEREEDRDLYRADMDELVVVVEITV